MLASWVGVQMPRVTSFALTASYFSLAALPPLLSSHASSSVFAVATPPSRAFACVQWHLSTALQRFAAAWMRNRSYTAGNPFTQVPRVERSHVPPGQSALRPHCLPALLPPIHVPPSTSEKKPSPWPSSCRTTVTKSSSEPAFASVP